MIASPPPKRRPPAIERTNGAHMRATTLLSSFGYAFAGVWHLLSTQRNAKIHVTLGLAAFGALHQPAAPGIGRGIANRAEHRQARGRRERALAQGQCGLQ